MRFLYPARIGIWRFWFSWREENRRTRRKTLGARGEPARPTYSAGPHWWEASALTTAPSLRHPCSLLEAIHHFNFLRIFPIVFRLQALRPLRGFGAELCLHIRSLSSGMNLLHTGILPSGATRSVVVLSSAVTWAITQSLSSVVWRFYERIWREPNY